MVQVHSPGANNTTHTCILAKSGADILYGEYINMESKMIHEVL